MSSPRIVLWKREIAVVSILTVVRAPTTIVKPEILSMWSREKNGGD
jgi:hypothetical protein